MDCRTGPSRRWKLGIAGCVLMLIIAEEPVKRGVHGEFAKRAIEVGRDTREYRLVAPKSVDLTRPAPLVIALHGIGIDSKDLMPLYTKLNATAEKHGFLLVYPNAIDRSWGLSPEKIRKDLEFLDALIRRVSADYRVEPRRIHLLGMSNGGYFAHLAARERSKVIASVASHSGPLGLQTLLGVRAERKFPVMIIHGDRDKLFPVAFARENRDKYRREGHEVEYLEIPGLGHFWGENADVNEKIHAFFEGHPLPESKPKPTPYRKPTVPSVPGPFSFKRPAVEPRAAGR
jgi:polyhydroxybutyrate depolymerase